MKPFARVWRLALAVALVSTYSLSQAQNGAHLPLPPGSFLSGGVGLEDQAAMREQRNHYNLRLSFAEHGTGAYLAGVSVSLLRHRTHESIGPFDDSGPMLYLRLLPGTYRLAATYAGVTRNSTLQVSHRGVDHVMYWPAR